MGEVFHHQGQELLNVLGHLAACTYIIQHARLFPTFTKVGSLHLPPLLGSHQHGGLDSPRLCYKCSNGGSTHNQSAPGFHLLLLLNPGHRHLSDRLGGPLRRAQNAKTLIPGRAINPHYCEGAEGITSDLSGFQCSPGGKMRISKNSQYTIATFYIDREGGACSSPLC